jgi:hypothetical protein
VRLDQPEEEEPAHPCVMVHAFDPNASISIRGVVYEPVNGQIVIPAFAVADAINHGWTGPIVQEEA